MNWRREFMGEFSRRLALVARDSRKSVWVGLIKLVNAVWFAGLWQSGLAASPALFIWLGFFVASMALAIWLDAGNSEINREKENG